MQVVVVVPVERVVVVVTACVYLCIYLCSYCERWRGDRVYVCEYVHLCKSMDVCVYHTNITPSHQEEYHHISSTLPCGKKKLAIIILALLN